jgi:DMSO/TMAO reductase YedYZ molybdopterin-dependent catalytic subunit
VARGAVAHILNATTSKARERTMRRKKKGPPIIVTKTLERRTVLEWLGKASVIALGGELIAACSAVEGSTPANTGNRSPIFDAECEPVDYPFQPGDGEHDVFASWGERTVDPQDLVQILQNWQLTIGGLVENPLTLSFADLLALPRQDQITDFHCVEGWSVHDVPWNGVHFDEIFDLVKPLDSATHAIFTCVGDKYLESLPLDVVFEPHTLLGYGVDCATLPLAHGFPLRVVVPRKWGYKGPKYVYKIQLSDQPAVGYWEQYGYPYDGDVPADRLREGKY